MRWAVAGLATLVGVTQLALFAVAERQVQDAVTLTGGPAELAWMRWVWVGGWAAPWFVGAVLSAARRRWSGTAVVLTAAALLLATGLNAAGSALVWPPLDGLGAASDAVDRFGGALVWLLGLATAVLAWSGRPRGGWREDAPGPVGWFVTLAVLAWLPSAFRTTEFAPPGAPRRFVDADVLALSGLAEVSSYLGAFVVAAVLWVAPRLHRRLAGAVLLTFALPTALAAVGDVMRVRTEEFVIFTPSGVLGAVGVLGLAITGVVWSLRPVLSDAATGPDRRRGAASHPAEPDPG
jgi:hypothetical protein